MSPPSLTKAGLLPGLIDGRAERPVLPVLSQFRFTRARTHEVCGPARRFLAVLMAGADGGRFLWIRPRWLPDRLYPDGMVRWCEPGRMVEVAPVRTEDLLWCTEEALRSGTVGLVVVELPQPPALTPVRRLNLAAEEGASRGSVVPMAVLLTAGNGGAAGVESRWHMGFAHGPDRTAWRVTRMRDRTLPPARWLMTDTGIDLHLSGPVAPE
jgi:protein ImuA